MMTTPLIYGLLVTSAPYGNNQASRALQLARTILTAGHKLPRIFFYQDGVLNANQLLCPAADETNIYQGWCELAQQYGVALEVCAAAAQRRGVLDQREAKLAGMEQFNLGEPFVFTGLVQLAEMAEQCDRVLQI